MNYPVKIGDLADFVHDRSNPWKGLALLHLYLDESGIHAKSKITAIGGFVGSKATWESLEEKWLKALSDIGVSSFHAYDCETGNGEFDGVQKEIRLAMAERLARITRDHDLLPVWSAVVNEDWDSSVTDDFLEKYPKPVYLCFAEIASRISKWSERMGGSHSEQDEMHGQIDDIWSSYRANKTKANLSSFTTASYKSCAPLQSADQVAYELCLDWQNREYGIYGKPPPLHYFERSPYSIMKERLKFHMGGTFGKEGLDVVKQRGL
jgi:hypothetical protein